MLIFWKQRLVFLANTKAGSTAIEMALESLAHVAVTRPPVLKHTPAAAYTRFIAPFLEATSGATFTTVALMREPVDWLGSWYRYRMRPELPRDMAHTEGLDFATFVEGYLARPQAAYAQLGTQSQFLTDPEGRPIVDRLFRYEEMGLLIDFLEDQLGCEIILPRVNVSPPAPVDLPADLRARLQAYLAADYALYQSLPRSATGG